MGCFRGKNTSGIQVKIPEAYLYWFDIMYLTRTNYCYMIHSGHFV